MFPSSHRREQPAVSHRASGLIQAVIAPSFGGRYCTSLLLREANPRASTRIKDNILALQEDIAKDIEPNTSGILNTTETLRGSVRRIVDVASRHSVLNTANSDREVGQCRLAGKDVTTCCGTVT